MPSDKSKQETKSDALIPVEEAVAFVDLPPAERIRQAVELTLREYGVTREELKARKNKLHIKIVYYEA